MFKAPITAEALEHAMAWPFDGNKETAKKFARRIYRIADVLQEMGAEVDMQEVSSRWLAPFFQKRFRGKRLRNSSPLSKNFSASYCWKIHMKSKKESVKPGLEVLLHMIQERRKLSKTMGKVLNEGTPEKSGPSKVLDGFEAQLLRGQPQKWRISSGASPSWKETLGPRLVGVQM